MNRGTYTQAHNEQDMFYIHTTMAQHCYIKLICKSVIN